MRSNGLQLERVGVEANNDTHLTLIVCGYKVESVASAAEIRHHFRFSFISLCFLSSLFIFSAAYKSSNINNACPISCGLR